MSKILPNKLVVGQKESFLVALKNYVDKYKLPKKYFIEGMVTYNGKKFYKISIFKKQSGMIIDKISYLIKYQL